MPYKDPVRQSAHQFARMRARRRAWLEANGPCVDCGTWIDLEVDHVDRKKKISHKVWSWSDSRRAVELAKCQPRCKECHKKKTRADVYGERKHGTANMWRREKCRCDECRRYAREYQARWRKATGRH